MWILETHDPAVERLTFRLPAGSTNTIGRAAGAQFIVEAALVSRLHCQLTATADALQVKDLGSTNGTFVNGRQIYEPHWLLDQDLIGLSAHTALLRFVDPDSTLQLTRRLCYDWQTMTFFLDQKPIDLSPVQFRLLHHLYEHAGSVCTRTSCAEAIWGRAYDHGLDAEALDRTVSNLRRQLVQIDPTADLIEMRQTLGYVLNI
jgi:DNA-binding response OmpR family regulator